MPLGVALFGGGYLIALSFGLELPDERPEAAIAVGVGVDDRWESVKSVHRWGRPVAIARSRDLRLLLTA